ncbi:MAG: G5 domain-containing protein [Actinomycetaceae bacterium]|nr:G5 domain-containing protein [Actinomycetaceae bacterium]
MGRHSGTNTETRELFELRFAEAIAAPVAGSRLAARRAERVAQTAEANPVPLAHTPVADTPSEAGMLEVVPESALYRGAQTTSTPVRTLSPKRQTRAAITALAAAASGIVAVGTWSTDNTPADTSKELASLSRTPDVDTELYFETVSFTVTVDGETQTITTRTRTVADALKDANIIVGENDRVSVPMSSEVVDGSDITIVRVEVRNVTVEEEQPFETVKENDATLEKGKERVAREGSNGLVRNTYDVIYEDGVEVGRELALSVQLNPKVDKVIKVGTAENVAAAASAAAASGAVVPAGTAQQIAHDKVVSRGWGEDQFSCLVSLWNRESGWRTTAGNPVSGAYGIPQALPGSKMASAGADWATNPATQIEWGLGYISGRYGTPCGALGHSHSTGWY